MKTKDNKDLVRIATFEVVGYEYIQIHSTAESLAEALLKGTDFRFSVAVEIISGDELQYGGMKFTAQVTVWRID